MNCNFCEITLGADANFCSRCGNAISQRDFDASTPRVPMSNAQSVFTGVAKWALASRIGASTMGFGLLGLWVGSIMPFMDMTTGGAIGAIYGALRRL